MMAGTVLAVSYTHLDVYKRQEYYYLGWHYPEKIAGLKKILVVYISHTI